MASEATKPLGAEDQSRRLRQVFLKNWQAKLGQFLEFNERSVLPGSGRISREQADGVAHPHSVHFAPHRREAPCDQENGRQIMTAKPAKSKLSRSANAGLEKPRSVAESAGNMPAK